ncbi:hypothetical protein DPMN_114339 [Dreissena polymorpha]|uniref:Uncharacterized protein n=1 Tax=Dreissena polymorpha TaxID=45954 RepID=A0A9D4KKQ0_DREPO|nr:hypothetical protein DPMN_114339 [Dreissena polymorpha]
MLVHQYILQVGMLLSHEDALLLDAAQVTMATPSRWYPAVQENLAVGRVPSVVRLMVPLKRGVKLGHFTGKG